MKHICLLFHIEQTVPLDMYFIKMIIFVLFTYNLIKSKLSKVLTTLCEDAMSLK